MNNPIEDRRNCILGWIQGLRRNDVKQITEKYCLFVDGQKCFCGVGIFLDQYHSHRWEFQKDILDPDSNAKQGLIDLSLLRLIDPKYNWIVSSGYAALIVYVNDTLKWTFQKQAEFLEKNIEDLIYNKCPDLTEIEEMGQIPQKVLLRLKGIR